MCTTVSSAAGGLSPRVRGNPLAGVSWLCGIGSIPACAGEPQTPLASSRKRRVYPRVCGGTAANTAIPTAAAGLSPRVRGNRRQAAEQAVFRGSIPACAGEPGSGSSGSGIARVYPRVCGGTSIVVSPIGRAGGLSPRVRGNPCTPLRFRSIQRSIPACAGEPHHADDPRIPAAVYPRVCGGTSRHPRRRRSPRGLSPRVRGNRA